MFTHVYFFPFLCLAALCYWLLPKQVWRNAWLSLCSMAYIGYLDHEAFIVVLALTVFTYGVAVWLERTERKKLAHRTGVIGLLLVLIIFKYLGLLSATIYSAFASFHSLPVFHIEKLYLPLGLSYIVFKYISYLTDIFWGIVKKGRWVDFLCYGSLFTIFVAGPIERFSRLKPQFENELGRFKLTYLDTAFTRIALGLFKKLVLADWLGYFCNSVWQNPDQYGAMMRALALFGYGLQIYFDFAGYSDMAIGSSQLFGLTIMENFNNPYLAPNMSQFWRRWHISLSDWIRDYLFFPLSGYRTSRFWLLFCVPIIAMGLCGLWHGSAWHFIIWGIWHGLGISVHQYWQQYKRKHKTRTRFSDSIWFTRVGTALTFLYVTLGWLWFR